MLGDSIWEVILGPLHAFVLESSQSLSGLGVSDPKTIDCHGVEVDAPASALVLSGKLFASYHVSHF